MSKSIRNPTILHALIPLVLLIFLLSINVYLFGDDALFGPNQLALLLSAAAGGIIAVKLGHNWFSIRERIVKSIGSAMPSMIILLLIGSLAGTWLLSGVVPAMIYYGLLSLNPAIFLLVCVVITAMVSVATGSSWSTVATIGIALIGIGHAMGFNEGMVAGAIISGAYFGDKMSPLSDTTNLASAMAGTDLFTHIKYMFLTTGPSIAITLVIFFIMGLFFTPISDEVNIQATLSALEDTFFISPVLFAVPVILVIIIVNKVPPLPSLLAGTLLGAVFAVIFQPSIIEYVSGITDNYLLASYIAVINSMGGRIAITTPDPQVTDLLSTGGMAGMLNTIWLIMAAMIFGGVMEGAGMLARITRGLMRFAKTTGSLVATTASACLFFNITASDQYISVVVPGRMFAGAFKDKNLKPEVLSRTLEDSGTVTSVLIPWSTCGATQSAILGVPTFTYLPYSFFNIISPFMSVFMASFNIKIRRLEKEKQNEKPGMEIGNGS